MNKGKIYLVRHGESEANKRRVFAGQKDDSLLTNLGRQQAREAALKLKKKGIKIDHVISSPLKRAHETAKIIVNSLNEKLEIVVDTRIAEYDMGAMSGTPFRSLTSLEFVTADGAEDPVKFEKRVHELIEEVKNLNKNVLLVSHGGVGRVIENKKQGKHPSLFYDIKVLSNTEIIEI